MAVGGFAVDDNSRAFSGKVTASVVITCIVAASGGLIFGYDIGISGEYRFFSFLSIFVTEINVFEVLL
ncbi:Sugar transport protein 1 [Vitis vinifera]|uniref:Sugar transport protein 1 n=1 Tax=Vitis vinifera TaxID=29760 RepID=A0A438FZR4_VITVI|nr:Sugar transport protein 1 [Vitis vinifera]RVW65456.1 Sugar transport protein 1 [Vitis vinifera]